MNHLKGHIEEIQTRGALSLVRVSLGDFSLSAMLIDTAESADFLEEGREVFAVFKETEVILGKGEALISVMNCFEGVVLSVEEGKLLSKVELGSGEHRISTVLTTLALSKLNVKVQDKLNIYVKTNEIMISE